MDHFIGDINIPQHLADEAIANGTTVERICRHRLKPPLDRVYRGGVMDLLVFSRRWASLIAPVRQHLVISLTDPDKPDLAAAPSDSRCGILRLKFDDATKGPYVLMEQSHSDQIVTFIKSNWSPERLVVVHCEAGLRRSAGVAAALSRKFNGKDQFFFDYYIPNRLVYQNTLNALS